LRPRLAGLVECGDGVHRTQKPVAPGRVRDGAHHRDLCPPRVVLIEGLATIQKFAVELGDPVDVLRAFG
jgi:hypothetical protein